VPPPATAARSRQRQSPALDGTAGGRPVSKPVLDTTVSVVL